jgi:hypothetical protein
MVSIGTGVIKGYIASRKSSACNTVQVIPLGVISLPLRWVEE